MVYKLFDYNTNTKGIGLGDIKVGVNLQAQRLKEKWTKQHQAGIKIGEKARNIIGLGDQSQKVRAGGQQDFPDRQADFLEEYQEISSPRP
ncbi:MAG: hypothetical protein ACKO47_00945 [Alphaproteobacteria bacterium]